MLKISHTILISTGALSLLSCMNNGNNDKKRTLPNIILILADDMGYGDLCCYGASSYSTPAIDRMAAEGMRFTQFYVAGSTCVPSRAGLMTACYPNRIGLTNLRPGSTNSEIGIHPSEETLAELFKKGGYITGLFGKWHLGNAFPFLPLQQGFDEYTGLLYSNDMWHLNYDGTKATPEQGERSARISRFPPLMLVEGNEPVREIRTMEDQSELTTIYTEKAVEFIQRNRSKPFFLYLAHSMPHIPLAVSDKFRGKSSQGMYGDVIMEIDWSVGEIVKTLEEIGLTNNTLVIFTSDNGPWLYFGNHAGSSGGLREGKATSWEGGQRVPCIMKWPEVIPAGRVNNRLASTLDFLPTFAEITGIPLSGNKIDGISIFPLLEGKPEANPRESFFYYDAYDLIAVRKNEWKLVFPHTHITYEGIVPGKDGEISINSRNHYRGKDKTGVTGTALYNLRRDPGERHNVIDHYPDVLDGLLILAEEVRGELGDGLMNITGKEIRKAGHIRK